MIPNMGAVFIVKRLLVLSFRGNTSSELVDQGYKNRIKRGSYLNPSICRNGVDHYLVNTSFEYFLGMSVVK